MFKTHSLMERKEPQVRVIFWQSLFRSLKQLYKAQPQKCYLMMELVPSDQETEYYCILTLIKQNRMYLAP